MKRAVLSWSSGKDAAWALHLVRSSGNLEIIGLLSTINAAFQRVSMHGVRRRLLELQAQALGLPWIPVELPWPCSNQQYEHHMAAACATLRARGAEAIVFGDIFLSDVRRYREQQLAATGLEPVFPLWGLDTRSLVHDMIQAGVRARIACLDPARLPRHFAGAELTLELLRGLPEDVDPCGENGEFHTFVFDAPGFSQPLQIIPGDTIERDGFLYADLLPASSPAPRCYNDGCTGP